MLVAQSCLILWNPWTVGCQVSLFMEFPRQEYWNGLSFPSPENLPDPGIKPMSPELAGRSRQILYYLSHQGSHKSQVNMDCSLTASSAYGILQAMILEWVAVLFSRVSSQPRDQTQISCIAGRFFTNWAMICFYNPLLCFIQFSSVTHLCPTLQDPIDCSTPGLPVHHQLTEFIQTHVHWFSDAIQPSHLLSSPSPPTFSLSQHQGLFKRVSSLHQVAKILEFQLQHQFFQWTPMIDLL